MVYVMLGECAELANLVVVISVHKCDSYYVTQAHVLHREV